MKRKIVDKCADCQVPLEIGIKWQIRRKVYCRKCFVKQGGKVKPIVRSPTMDEKAGKVYVE